MSNKARGSRVMRSLLFRRFPAPPFRLLLAAFGIVTLLQNAVFAGTPGAESYTYDALGRLILVSSPDGTNSSYNYDAAGNRKSIDTGADVTPPTTPSGLHTTAMTSTTVSLGWTGSTDSGSGLAGYYIYRNASNTPLGTSSVASYSDTTTTGTTNYQYVVKAYDHAGNISSPSNTLLITTPDTVPPPQVTGLTATAFSGSQINLSWNRAVNTGGSGTSYYKVFRNSTLLTTVAAPSVTFSDTGLAGSITYSYNVQAVDGAGNIGLMSANASAKTPDTIPPPQVTGLTATAASGSQINLSWNIAVDTGGSGTSYYKVYRNSALLTTVAAPNVAFSDTGLAGSITYSYNVQAVDGAGNIGLMSASASAKTPDTIPPPQVTGLTAAAVSASQINLSWNIAVDTGGSGTSYYKIYRNSALLTTVAAPSVSFSDTTGLAGSTSYSYSVQAVDGAGNIGLMSASASATTPSSFTAPGTPQGYSPTMGVASVITGGSSGGTPPYTYYLEGCWGLPCTFTVVATSSTGNFTATGLVHAVVYSFRARAKDATGAYSPYSGIGTISIQ